MHLILKLVRIRLSLAVALSTLPGFFLAARSVDWRAVFTLWGVFFLAAAASALNQLQEQEQDALMARTADRPLPAGRLRPGTALFTGGTFGTAGFLILLLGTGPAPALLGAGNLAWYNLVYTLLKTKTRWALFAGALTGAVPMAIGWTAAGGVFSDPALYILALFMFLWQIPHFLLLTLAFGHEYAAAGIPCFLAGATERRSRATIAFSVLGTTVSTTLFFTLRIIANPIPGALIAVSSAGTAAYFSLMLLIPGMLNFVFASRALYVYQLLVLTGIALQGLW